MRAAAFGDTLSGMNDTPITFYRSTEPQPLRPGALRELSVVALVRPATTDDGTEMPAGSEGTIVGIWAGGEAYEVEFVEPVAGLATVEAAGLRPVSPTGR